MAQYTNSSTQLPPSVQVLLKYFVEVLNPKWVKLFGSRARGDFRENSDYDLAVNFDLHKRTDWLKLKSSLDDKPLTLLPVDLVDYNSVNEDYKKNIDSEGILIYG